MPREELRPAKSFDALEQPQLEIYAKELQQHFREHRRLRKELNDLNLVLQQRIRELEALNRLFQQHLAERDTTEEAYRNLLAGLQDVTLAGDALVEKAKTYRIPELRPGPWAEDSPA